MVRVLLFDLDETLYPPRTGMFDEVAERIHRYMERIGLSPAEIPQMRHRYLQRYGTTLRGLQLHHQVDTNDYLHFVHDFDVTHYIRPNRKLDAVLRELPQEKVLFTNATAEYAHRVLRALGIAHHFEQIFDIRAIRFHSKPDPEAYRIVLENLSARGEDCLLIEDNISNLQAGKKVGMYTMLVGNAHGPVDHVDFVVDDVIQVREVVQAIDRGEVPL